ncbi:MAG: transposase, partial [Flavisolibacter sp.]|nr:transposase [Flavisolibacter sp.]
MRESGYKIRNKEGIPFITFAVVGWIDVFTRKEYRDIVLDSLRYCQREKGLILCLMSNHVHLVAAAKDANLSEVLRD